MKKFKGRTVVKSSFKAHPIFKNNHVQTLWPALIRSTPKIKTVRERLTTPDHDFLDVDWYEMDASPLIILLHGLASSSKAKYILGLQKALAKEGFASVAMNLRGCSGEPNKRVVGYHGGATDDLDFLVKTLRERFPERVIGAVGYSLGANILLKWLGDQKESSPLFAAVSVSAPLQLNLATERLKQGLSKIYEKYLLTFMKWNQYKKNLDLYKRLEQHGNFAKEFDLPDEVLASGLGKSRKKSLFSNNKKRSVGAEPLSQKLHFDELEINKIKLIPPLWKINSIYDFDQYITAPIHDFQGADHYYEVCSSRYKLKSIHTPTLVIHAKDDPFMPLEIIPDPKELSASVMIELAENGGHVGFIAKGKDNKPDYWIESRVPYFFKQILSLQD